MSNFIKNSFQESNAIIQKIINDTFLQNQIEQAIKIFVNSFKAKGMVLSCGNGGSMSDAMHFAEELTGKFCKERPPLPAIAVSDPAYMSCVANDYGYDKIFERMVLAFGTDKGALLAISTSGNSQNVIAATKQAKSLGVKTIGLLGKSGGALKDLVDIPIIINAEKTERIQEIHIKIIHIFIEGIERELFPHLYQ